VAQLKLSIHFLAIVHTIRNLQLAGGCS